MYRVSQAILICLAIGQAQSQIQKKNLKKFPNYFKFGVSTSAYQIEGAWNEGGKGESIWDHAVHTEPHRITKEENGDEACDSYHKYERDVEMLRELDVDFYRFSISWPRILPTGFTGHVSEDGVAYYNNLINELVKYNITPIVTMYHWDLPQGLQEEGGWANPLIEGWFRDYAKVLFRKFGDRVKTWITVNGPHAICHLGYGEGKGAPFLVSRGIGEYHCAYNLLKAHAAAYNLYKNDFRREQKGSVGIALQITWPESLTSSPDDAEAVEDYRLFEHGIYLNPIFGNEGDFPSKVKERIANKSVAQGFITSRLPKFTPEEVNLVKGTADFIGLNHYTTVSVYRNFSLVGKYDTPSWMDDFGGGLFYNRKYRSGATEWLKVNPPGIRNVLKYIKDQYNNTEILITENGYSTKGGLRDDGRIKYIRKYLAEVLKAVLEDGVNVTGYAVFSLMDSFEWTDGYHVRFGLYEVNYSVKEKERTARKSAIVYKKIIRSRVIDRRYRPIYHVIPKQKKQVEYFKELVSSTGLDMADKPSRNFAEWMRRNMLIPIIKSVHKNNNNGTAEHANIYISNRTREWETNELHLKLDTSNTSQEVNQTNFEPIPNVSKINNTQGQNESKLEYNPTISIKNTTSQQNKTQIHNVLETPVNKTQSEPVSDILVTNNTDGQNTTNLEHILDVSVSNTVHYKNETELKRAVNITDNNTTHGGEESKSEHVPNVSNINNTQGQNESKLEYNPTISIKNNTSQQNKTQIHNVPETPVNKTQSEPVSDILVTNNTDGQNTTNLEHILDVSASNTVHYKNETELKRAVNITDNNTTHGGEESKSEHVPNVTSTNSTNGDNKTESEHPSSTTNSTLTENKTEIENLPSFFVTSSSLGLNTTIAEPKIDFGKKNDELNQTRTLIIPNIYVTNSSVESDITKSEKLPETSISNVTRSLNKTNSEPVPTISVINATHVHDEKETQHVPKNNMKKSTDGQNSTESEQVPNISVTTISHGQNETKINVSPSISVTETSHNNTNVTKLEPADNISIVDGPGIKNETISGNAHNVTVTNNTLIQ